MCIVDFLYFLPVRKIIYFCILNCSKLSGKNVLHYISINYTISSTQSKRLNTTFRSLKLIQLKRVVTARITDIGHIFMTADEQYKGQ